MTTYTLSLRPLTSTTIAPSISDGADGGYTTNPTYTTGEFAIGNFISILNGNTRFSNVLIPQGATIISAVMNGWQYGPGEFGRTVRGLVKVEEVDDAIAITTYADFMSRAWSSVSVSWEIADSAFGVFPDYKAIQSPDIKDIIQLIIDRAGWESGNSIQIGWMNNSSDNTGVFITVAGTLGFDGVSLDIEYSASSPVGTSEFVPSNLLQNQIEHPGSGQPFNLTLKQSSYTPIYGYILTESSLVLTTESLLDLEAE